MNEDLKQALVEYILTVRFLGWETGENFIAVQEEVYTDFRRWAYATAIMIRIDEILMAQL
jgi:hypothetical protein